MDEDAITGPEGKVRNEHCYQARSIRADCVDRSGLVTGSMQQLRRWDRHVILDWHRFRFERGDSS